MHAPSPRRLRSAWRALALLFAALGGGCASSASSAASVSPPPVNLLLITADDLNCDSVGAYGCRVPDITPNLDRLAREGLRFVHAHVNIAVCQPSRQSIMTGRYPLRTGAAGFDPIDEAVPTLPERLRAAGYLNGILGKEIHLQPKHKFCWDHYVTQDELASGAGIGRSPRRYREHTAAFVARARREGRPFFLMANIHDPHRPFAGSVQEQRAWGDDLPQTTRRIGEREVDVPGFLPDLDDTRKEVAEYFTSVHRCDESVGAILQALEQAGVANDTLVMFVSDNGMSFPFAKANCYLASTRTPWLVRWPGRVAPGSVDARHMVAGIDYVPTILDALGLAPIDGVDGASFLPLLRGGEQPERGHVFTEFHRTHARRPFPMRAVQGRRFGYLVNFWAGRTEPMRMDSTGGLTFRAMQAAARSDPAIAARVELFERRVLEEFYDFENDPDARTNLIADPRHQDEIERMRELLAERLRRTGDPALEPFLRRAEPAVLDAFMAAERARAAASAGR